MNAILSRYQLDKKGSFPNKANAEKVVDEIAEALLNELSKYPKDEPIDIEDFQENFMNVDITFRPEGSDNHFLLLIAILKILPHIYRNRMNKLNVMLRGLEETNITGEYSRKKYTYSSNRFIKPDIYFELIKVYLRRIKNRYTTAYTRYFSGLDGENSFEPMVISNTHLAYLISTILYRSKKSEIDKTLYEIDYDKENSVLKLTPEVTSPSKILPIGDKRQHSPSATFSDKRHRYPSQTLPTASKHNRYSSATGRRR